MMHFAEMKNKIHTEFHEPRPPQTNLKKKNKAEGPTLPCFQACNKPAATQITMFVLSFEGAGKCCHIRKSL